MHDSAYAYVEDFYRRLKAENPGTFYVVLEFGSRDINGSVRKIFQKEGFWGIDLESGRGVDEVANASGYEFQGKPADIVVCCEVLEHTPHLRGIIEAAYENLGPGGWLVITCATHPRAPHSAVDGGYLRPQEYYLNVSIQDLKKTVHDAGFEVHDLQFRNIKNHGGDLYMTARKS